jgi:hypothetical protein
MAQEVFHSIHLSARICGVPCYMKILWDRSSQEKLGRSQTNQGWEKISPEWCFNRKENHLVCFFKNITGKKSM